MTQLTPAQFKGRGAGLVPRVGTQAGKLLKDDGTWATQALEMQGEVAGGSIAAASGFDPGDFFYINATAGGFTEGKWAISNGSSWVEVDSISGLLPAASQSEVDGGTVTGKYVDPATLAGNVRPQFAARTPRPRKGVVSDGTAFAALLENPDAFAPGTGDITPFVWAALDDWTPASVVYLHSNDAGASTGFQWGVHTDGTLRLFVRATATFYYSTAATGVTDGQMALLAAAMDRNGDLVFYVNGSQLGDPVDMSGSSAVSFNSTVGLHLGGNNGAGQSNTVTYGESGIIDGLATAAQISNAHALGTFRGLGLTPYFHWEPSDTLGYGIFEDISGNNNHAVLGASGVEPNWQIDLPTDSGPVQALRSDGSDGNLYADLNSQVPLTGDFSILVWPDNMAVDSATASNIVKISSETDGDGTTGEFAFDTSTDQYLRVITRSAGSTSNSNSAQSEGLYPHAQGQRCGFLISRDSSAATIQIYYWNAGKVLDVTNLFVFGTGGTPPGWGQSIAGPYINHFARGSESLPADLWRPTKLYNVAATTVAEAENAMSANPTGKFAVQGNGSEPFSNATFTNRNEASGSYGTLGNGYEILTGNTATGFTAGHGAGQVSQLGRGEFTYSTGDVFDVFFDITLDTGTSPASVLPTRAGLTSSLATSSVDRSNDVGPSITEGSNVHRVIATGNNSTGFFSFIHNNVAPQSTFTVSNFRIARVGETTGLSLSDGGGYQPKNPAADWNDSTHWTMSDSGVEWIGEPAKIGDFVAIQKTYTDSEISSPADVTAHGLRAAKWQVQKVIIKVTEAFDAATTLDVGLLGTSDAIASAMVLDSTGYKRTLSSNAGVSDTNGSIYLKKNQATTQGAVTVTVILERVF